MSPCRTSWNSCVLTTDGLADGMVLLNRCLHRGGLASGPLNLCNAITSFCCSNWMQVMSVLTILVYPDPRLRKKAKSIERIDSAIRVLAENMIETMYDAPGIGLAAPQVAVPARLFVMDCSKKNDEREPRVLLNPRIFWKSPETLLGEEGCLSLPTQYAEVERHAEVSVEFEDLDGNRVKESFSGLWSRCVQHEMDHLDGKLFIDHLSLVKREMIKRKMKKELRERQKS